MARRIRHRDDKGRIVGKSKPAPPPEPEVVEEAGDAAMPPDVEVASAAVAETAEDHTPETLTIVNRGRSPVNIVFGLDNAPCLMPGQRMDIPAAEAERVIRSYAYHGIALEGGPVSFAADQGPVVEFGGAAASMGPPTAEPSGDPTAPLADYQGPGAVPYRMPPGVQQAGAATGPPVREERQYGPLDRVTVSAGPIPPGG